MHTAVQLLTNLYNELTGILNWLATNIPITGFIASGLLPGFLLGPQKAVKKWFVHHEAIIISIVGAVGVTATFVWSYVLHNYGTNPDVVALQGLGVSFGSQPFYFIIWKPLVAQKLIPAIKSWWSKLRNDAESINEARSAVEPAEGVQAPAAAPKQIVDIQDFSK